jgi:hypothetical protein
MPSHVRAALGARMLDAIFDLLDLTLRVAFEPSQSAEIPALLKRCNQHVTFLRYLLRIALERRYFAEGQHTFAIEKLDEVGRVLGGWRRSLPRSSP